MRNFNLNDLKVTELTTNELHEIIGGGWWSDFKQGFVDGFTYVWDKLIELVSAL
jgi:bacteriocin-like protein